MRTLYSSVLFLALVCPLRAEAPAQYSVMVWDGLNQSVCPFELKQNDKTRMEVPLDDSGKPIMSKARVYGTIVKFNSDCGHIEIRRK